MEFIVMYFLFYGYVNFDEMGRNENLLVKKRCL